MIRLTFSGGVVGVQLSRPEAEALRDHLIKTLTPPKTPINVDRMSPAAAALAVDRSRTR